MSYNKTKFMYHAIDAILTYKRYFLTDTQCANLLVSIYEDLKQNKCKVEAVYCQRKLFEEFPSFREGYFKPKRR